MAEPIPSVNATRHIDLGVILNNVFSQISMLSLEIQVLQEMFLDSEEKKKDYTIKVEKKVQELKEQMEKEKIRSKLAI